MAHSPNASDRRPAARASAARDNLAYVDVYRPGSVARIREGIPTASLEAMDKTAGISWLDYEHDHWLMDRTLEVLGREASIECWRASIGNLIEKPLLKNFAEGGLRLFGAKPGKILRMVPKGWSLAYRDFCVPSFHGLGDGHAELRFENIAPEAFASPGYLHCWHAICLGIFDLEKPVDGRVDFEISRETESALARFSWRA